VIFDGCLYVQTELMVSGGCQPFTVYSTVNSHLTLQESEFEAYEIYYAPITLGIHLKELNVSSLSLCFIMAL
jgi:hypothetical protein